MGPSPSKSSKCPPPGLSAEDVAHISRINRANVITNIASEIDFLHQAGPHCIRVQSNNKNEVVLENCKNFINTNVVMSDKSTRTTNDKMFFYNQSTHQIMAVRDRKGCLYVDPNNGKLKYNPTGCDAKNVNQKFTINPNTFQIVSDSTGKCLMAKNFVEDSQAVFNRDLNEDVPSRKIVLGDCPTRGLNQLTIFDTAGNSLFQIGDSKIDRTIYFNLVNLYNELLNTTAADHARLLAEWQTKYQYLQSEYDATNTLYQDQIAKNEMLQEEILKNKKRSFDLIVAQTDAILKRVRTIKDGNNTEYKSNSYQIEQNAQIQYVHKVLFWTYFVIAMILYIVLLLHGDSLFYIILIIVITVIYPFIIIFIQYGIAFLYYYIAFVTLGQPFIFNKMPPTNSAFFTP